MLHLPWADAAIGAVAGYASLALIAALYRRARGVDGLGLGDAKLLAAAGVWIGWRLLPFAVLFAAAAGLTYVAVLRLAGKQIARTDALAFGPFLCAGVFIAWLARFALF